MGPLRRKLVEHRFGELFRDELGWDRASGTFVIHVDERPFRFDGVAQKRGFQVLHCKTDRCVLLNRGLLRRAQRQLSKLVHEHLVIYSCDEPPKQVWQWAVRYGDGARVRHREHPFFSASPPAAFVRRLKALRFSLDEEGDVTIVDALHRIRRVLDVAPELNLFAKRPWYAERSDALAVAMREGRPGAFEELIVLNWPLARYLARRFLRRTGLDADDAEQIAIIGEFPMRCRTIF